VIRHFTASGIIISDDFDHVLLIEHRKLGCWLYPGGHIDPDEDPVQAVLREVSEETGITCQITAETRFSHPETTVLAAPFTICVQDIPGDATHQHIDMVYLYELFRLSIRRLQRRDSPGHGRAVAVQGCP
jgi:8-oxo-dGTP pyrophosphatase MutT (NUDIX family)